MKPLMLITLVLLATLLVQTRAETAETAPTTNTPATQPAPVERVTLYVAIVRPGPEWRAHEAAKTRPDMTAHLAYGNKLRAEGKQVFGGPFADGTGGLLVYRADTIEQAREFINNDPATRANLFEYDMHPWLVNAADLPNR